MIPHRDIEFDHATDRNAYFPDNTVSFTASTGTPTRQSPRDSPRILVLTTATFKKNRLLPPGRFSTTMPAVRRNTDGCKANMSANEPVWASELLDRPHETADKATRVRRMFNAIAPRYELVNRVFSGGRDSAWRRRAVEAARITPEDCVIDIACGTGDFARAFAAAGPRLVVGLDFAGAMLDLAARRSADHTYWVEADALSLPFPDQSFSVASCAFGVRNFQRLSEGLAEMRRVLRPGGRAVILEFSNPRGRVWGRLYRMYAQRIMPVAATWLSRDKSGAYRYLPRSVESFLSPTELADALRAVGFDRVTPISMTMGIVTILIATVDQD